MCVEKGLHNVLFKYCGAGATAVMRAFRHHDCDAAKSFMQCSWPVTDCQVALGGGLSILHARGPHMNTKGITSAIETDWNTQLGEGIYGGAQKRAESGNAAHKDRFHAPKVDSSVS